MSFTVKNPPPYKAGINQCFWGVLYITSSLNTHHPHKDSASCLLLREGNQCASDGLLPVLPVSQLVCGQRGDTSSRLQRLPPSHS